MFVPFLGAYVKYTRGNPWQTARVAIAGPILGGLAALAFYLVGKADRLGVLIALGYFGFFINLLNLIPIAILDGGAIWRSTRWLWIGGGRQQGARLGRALRRHRDPARARRLGGVPSRSTASDGRPPHPRRPRARHRATRSRRSSEEFRAGFALFADSTGRP